MEKAKNINCVSFVLIQGGKEYDLAWVYGDFYDNIVDDYYATTDFEEFETEEQKDIIFGIAHYTETEILEKEIEYFECRFSESVTFYIKD